MERGILVLEGVESLGNATDSIGDNQEAHAAMVRGMVDQQTSQIRDAADVGEKVDAAAEGLFREHFPWLLDLWIQVKSLAPTRLFNATSWALLVDVQARVSKGKGSTKEASNFTLARFASWAPRLKAWINHEDIQKVARTSGRNTKRTRSSTVFLCGRRRRRT